MKREISFRVMMTKETFGHDGLWVYSTNRTDWKSNNGKYYGHVNYETEGEFSGFLDKKGNKIYEGDIIEYKTPYRTTQTHTGDNIPNGSYTEPMEPGIRFHQGEIIFKNGCFHIYDADAKGEKEYPLMWALTDWDLEGIKEAISYSKPEAFIFDDPEEGDLQYLMQEAKVESSEELIKFFTGFDVVGNIYENPELV